ncbi:MAG TPA: hypothetical protein VHA52_12685, partial [Candidatus Babeliaceae bacterium]|nr:hypothetical protein [Candidatus Babeliaceae bacterium]
MGEIIEFPIETKPLDTSPEIQEIKETVSAIQQGDNKQWFYTSVMSNDPEDNPTLPLPTKDIAIRVMDAKPDTEPNSAYLNLRKANGDEWNPSVGISFTSEEVKAPFLYFVYSSVTDSWTKKVSTVDLSNQLNKVELEPTSVNVAETGKTVSDYVTKRVVAQDTLFEVTGTPTGQLLNTAAGTGGYNTVTTLCGFSASIGVLPNPSNQVTVYYQQGSTNKITNIEIRFFKGKAPGGDLIQKKRVSFTAATGTIASQVITLDSTLDYPEEMWCQIMANNPFYVRLQTNSPTRNEAAGYAAPKATATNNLDGTTFETTLSYFDLFIAFNILEPKVSLTNDGKELLVQSSDVLRNK